SIGETTSCTVMVTDASGDSVAGGTVTITTDGDGTFSPSMSCPSGGSEITCNNIWGGLYVDYTPNSGSLDTTGSHTLTATYSGTDSYESSSGTVNLLVIKRLTRTVLSCDDSGACSVSVTDEHPEGSSQIVMGDVYDENGSYLCWIVGGFGSFTFVADEDAKLIIAYYTGSETHYESISEPYFYPQDGLGEACLIPVGQMITSTNTACYGLNVAAIIVGSISDITCAWLGTVPFVGSTLSATCTSITSPITFALSLAAETNCYDADGDGISIWIEQEIGTNPSSSDTDNDGLSDGQEIDLAGGWIDKCPEDGLTYSPSPLIADSDGDGLNDGDELLIYQTDFSDTDTDDDGLTDYEEIMTYHTNPNLDDTDGDGVGDAVEVGKAGYDADTGTTTTDPLDLDTDNDGLSDGTEDLNGNGVQDASETDPNDFDTDDDGLGDGFELGSGCGCNPLLDDTDSDGLSDNEEVNITQTSCSVADSDGDGLNDANEFIVTSGMWPERSLEQVSDPLSLDTDGDGLGDQIEYPGSGIDRNTTAPPGGTGGTPDNSCPYVN
ncbi:Ig-like domain repeat protein, partial [Candidatus Bipolaricaulota bacterium]|nr:Ig-like domain repeat protein [Candidatus Bipolaricaulota bacterium]